jgi:signal transduction histidine kinase/CheY-like chemotaxis protein
LVSNQPEEKRPDELAVASKELAFQSEAKEKHPDELAVAHKELAFQNDEKEKRADELAIANKELAFQNDEKEKRADELAIANKELAFQNDEKEKRADELAIANKELAFQNDEKEKRADELARANKELAFQNDEKEKRADELARANKELAFQNDEKEKRADELVRANKELAFQNDEKEKRADELAIANRELAFQNDENRMRSDELVVANKEIVFQSEEKEKGIDELVVANKEIIFQSEEKEKRAAELAIANAELAFQNDEREKRVSFLKAQKMELIGHLTSGIAHDFNNILAAILGYTELLGTPSSDKVPLSARNQKYISQIHVAGNRATELISQMLIFSGLGLEHEIGNPPITALQPMVTEVRGLLRATIPSTIEINNHQENENLHIQIQPVHLHQILMNLAINSWQAMGEYGRIDIGTTRGNLSGVCVSCHQSYSGDYATVSLSDTGSGISELERTKMFDPYFSTKKKGMNSGMGLSIVHGIVHARGGHIQVESSAEGGTTFNLCLPLASPEDASQEITNTTSIENLKGLRIMVVDDESSLADLLYDYLTRSGAEVILFTDPVLAWEAFLLIGNSIDLVITDETMPGMSGMLLAKKLLNLKPSLPIILCTGYSNHANPKSAAKIGIAGFFYKPLKMSELILKIQMLRKLKQ